MSTLARALSGHPGRSRELRDWISDWLVLNAATLVLACAIAALRG